ncbi:MAG: RHS repeat-associated core domain-containing protein [Kiritimatiellia bacterium]
MVITMSFDRMGRRVTKNDKRFVYDGYLQIADNAGNAYVWDPTDPIATRPLAWQRSALDTQHSVHFYTHDGNKNISEVLSADGSLSAHYEYAPFGAVTAQSGTLASANTFRFSSEYAEDDLGLVYYNYRHYHPLDGRWLSQDPVDEDDDELLYAFCVNSPISGVDVLGRAWFVPQGTSSVGLKSVPFSVSLNLVIRNQALVRWNWIVTN